MGITEEQSRPAWEVGRAQVRLSTQVDLRPVSGRREGVEGTGENMPIQRGPELLSSSQLLHKNKGPVLPDLLSFQKNPGIQIFDVQTLAIHSKWLKTKNKIK